MPTPTLVLAALSAFWPRPTMSTTPPPEEAVDRGVFAITANGKRAGSEVFTVFRAGDVFEVRTTTVVALGGTTTRVKGRLRTDAAGRPLWGSFEATSLGRTTTFALSRSGGGMELMTRAPGRKATFTRPPSPPDFFVVNTLPVVSHLMPLCRLAAAKEQALTAFPAAPLRVSAAEQRTFPRTKLGTPSVELTGVTAELARSRRIEAVCDGPRLMAVRQSGVGLTAARASYEEVATALEARARAKPSLTESLVEQARVVKVPARGGAGAASLACSLVLPSTHAEMKRGKAKPKPAPQAAPGGLTVTPDPLQPLPGVVLLGDAGLHDRDGDSVGPGDFQGALLKVIAGRLGGTGMVSLRCDDRGAGKSTGNLSKATLDTLVSDARALLAALRSEAAVDPERISILGHGEGGTVAALAAREDTRIRALALLATPARPVDELLIEQSEASMRRFGYPDGEISDRLAEEVAVLAAIRAGKPLPAFLSPAEKRAVQTSLPWLRSHLRREPLEAPGKLAAPAVFLASGGQDVQVPSRDSELLRDSLTKAGNKQVLRKVYPELGHLFSASRTGSLADYQDPRAETDPVFLGDLAGFFRGAQPPAAVSQR